MSYPKRACHLTWQEVLEIAYDLDRSGAPPVTPGSFSGEIGGSQRDSDGSTTGLKAGPRDRDAGAPEVGTDKSLQEPAQQHLDPGREVPSGLCPLEQPQICDVLQQQVGTGTAPHREWDSRDTY